MQADVSELPQEVILHVLDFLEPFPLDRYFATNNISKFDTSLTVDYSKLIKLLFGYFSHNYEQRRPFLLFPNVEMTRHFGILPGSDDSSNHQRQCLVPIPITDEVVRKVIPWYHVKNLVVRNYEFRGTQLSSDAFRYLPESKKLRTIDLMSNKGLDNKIAPLFRNCTNLSKIILSGTKISSGGVKEIVFNEDGTPRLPKLRLLWLNGLQGIAINDKGVEQIFGDRTLPNLKLFAVQRSAITDEGAVPLVRDHLPDLKTLNIVLNQLTHKFLREMVFPESLTELDMGYSDLSLANEELQVLFDNKTIVRLGLMESHLVDEKVSALIARNNVIKVLDISGNSMLTAECLSTLGQNTSLTKLDMGENTNLFLSEKAAQYLSKSTSLKSLFLSDCDLSDTFFEQLFSERKSYAYHDMRLTNNPRLTSRSIQLIQQHVPNLEKIKLKNQNMPGIELAQALCGMSLKKLLLYEVGLTDEGAKYLFRNLKGMKHVDFNTNKLSDSALDAETIAIFLQNNPGLEKLHLHWNRFTDQVAKDLFDALVKIPNRVNLVSLAGNRLSDDCLSHLEPMNQAERPLKQLYVGNNNRITANGKQYLYDKITSIYHIFV
jgi:hypothetical protein